MNFVHRTFTNTCIIRSNGIHCVYISYPHTHTQALLSAKHTELERCGEKVRDLEGQLRATQRHSDKASALKMKKVHVHDCTVMCVSMVTLGQCL